MNFERLRLRVERREQLLDGRLSQTQTAYAKLRRNWREAWTPARIVIAGLLAGFVAGHAEPAKAIRRIGAIGGPQWIRTFSALSGLFASVQAIIAAVTAKSAAKTADQAAETADVAAETAGAAAAADASAATHASSDLDSDIDADADSDADIATTSSADRASPSDRRRRIDPAPDAPPRAAEAATDVSER
jgi:hypothetical protein